MSQFTYEARDEQGERITGVIHAEDQADASRLLSGRGQFVTKLSPADAMARNRRKTGESDGGRGVSRKDTMWFMSQLSIMIESGIPLSEALDCLSRQNLNEPALNMIAGISQTVQEGRTLSSAMAEYPRAFSATVIALVRASEASGTLSMILSRISDYLVQQDQIRSRVRGALMYPVMMFGLCLTVTVFLLTVILPRFADIFQSRGAALPAPTQWLMTLGHVISAYWIFWMPGLVILIAGCIIALRTAAGKSAFDQLILNLPVVGQIVRGMQQSQACNTLGTLLRAGVPLLDTLAMVRQSSANVHYQNLWTDVIKAVRGGDRLASPMFESPLIPEPVAQMIDSGDRSGKLGQVLSRLGEVLEEQHRQAIKNATQLLEPAMIIIMGAIIGFIAIALLLPLFSAGRVMAGG